MNSTAVDVDATSVAWMEQVISTTALPCAINRSASASLVLRGSASFLWMSKYLGSSRKVAGDDMKAANIGLPSTVLPYSLTRIRSLCFSSEWK